MIRLTLRGLDLGPTRAMLDQLSRPDLKPLAEELREIMIRDNREGLLAGLDADGSATAPVKESTIRRGRGGDGEARVPRSEGSRMISDYTVEVEPTESGYLLIGSWPNLPWVRFHQSGAPRNNMPARDPVGIRPEGMRRASEALFEFASTLVGGAR